MTLPPETWWRVPVTFRVPAQTGPDARTKVIGALLHGKRAAPTSFSIGTAVAERDSSDPAP